MIQILIVLGIYPHPYQVIYVWLVFYAHPLDLLNIPMPYITRLIKSIHIWTEPYVSISMDTHGQAPQHGSIRKTTNQIKTMRKCLVHFGLLVQHASLRLWNMLISIISVPTQNHKYCTCIFFPHATFHCCCFKIYVKVAHKVTLQDVSFYPLGYHLFFSAFQYIYVCMCIGHLKTDFRYILIFFLQFSVSRVLALRQMYILIVPSTGCQTQLQLSGVSGLNCLKYGPSIMLMVTITWE